MSALNKFLVSLAAGGVLAAASSSAFAAQTSTSVPVTVNLTSACSVSTVPGTITFNYTSLQGAAATPSTTVGVTCTNTLPYDLSFATDPTITLTTSGTLVGLNYDLSVPGGPFTGNGAEVSHTISGNMAANQAGTCGLATCTASTTHTLYIQY